MVESASCLMQHNAIKKGALFFCASGRLTLQSLSHKYLSSLMEHLKILNGRNVLIRLDKFSMDHSHCSFLWTAEMFHWNIKKYQCTFTHIGLLPYFSAMMRSSGTFWRSNGLQACAHSNILLRPERSQLVQPSLTVNLTMDVWKNIHKK